MSLLVQCQPSKYIASSSHLSVSLIDASVVLNLSPYSLQTCRQRRVHVRWEQSGHGLWQDITRVSDSADDNVQ